MLIFVRLFHQIVIRSEDRVSQRFLWRDGDNQNNPEEYEMVVMTLGAACFPCSARFVIKRNAFEHKLSDPKSAEAIVIYHYVDDFVVSFDNIEEAIRISKEVRSIHEEGGFDLRGFP